MNFDFTDDQQEIKRTAQRLPRRRARPARRSASPPRPARYDDALWTRARPSSAGPGIAIAEEHGGQGLGIVELAILLEELGYACAPTPFLASAVAGARRSRPPARDEQQAALARRARVRRGRAARSASPASSSPTPPAPTCSCSSTATGCGWSAGADADARAASTRSTRPAATRASPATARRRAAARRRRARRSTSLAVAVAAELVGIAQRALEMTRRVRQGAQAVRHARSAPSRPSRTAARRCCCDTERRPLGDLLRRLGGRRRARAGCRRPPRWPRPRPRTPGCEVTGVAIQVHGGIGFTWEPDVHWLYKRAQIDAALLGGAGAHRGRLARLAAAARGRAGHARLTPSVVLLQLP